MYLNVKREFGQHLRVPIEKLTPERRRQMTRDTLIEAACEVFAEKGYYGASLEEIADAAGFTRGAIYSNFGNKEELLLAVLEDSITKQLETVSAVMEDSEQPGPVRGAMSAGAIFGAGSPSRTKTALELELRLAAIRNPVVGQRLAEVERNATEQAVRLVNEELRRSGTRIPMPARDLVDLGRAAMIGLMQLAAVDEERAAHYHQLVERLFVVLAGLVTPKPAK